MSRAWLVWVAVVLCGAPGVGRADDLSAARAAYEAGTQDYEASDFAGALREFKRAYALSPRPALLYNIGVCNEKLGRFREAAEALRDYLARVPAEERHADIEARVALDERLAAQRVALEAPPSGQALLRVDLDAPAPSAPSRRRSWAYRHRAGLSLTLVGAAVLGASLGTGLSANTLANRVDDACAAGGGVCPTTEQGEAHRARALAIASDVLLGVGIAAGVGAVIAYIVESRRSRAYAHVAPEGVRF